ncbi:MAG: phycobiliprotein lyase [Cyanobacteria bacterium P01_A01_bin.17]
MDIHSFFQLSLGRWLVQRTSYSFVTQNSSMKTGEQSLEPLKALDPRILQICREAEIDSALAQDGLTATWKETTLGQPLQPQQVAILVPAVQGAQNGVLLRSNPLLLSAYILGQDRSLTLTQATAERHSQERIWFASDNLRLRTTLVHAKGRCLLSSFCSEVRLGVKSDTSDSEVTI